MKVSLKKKALAAHLGIEPSAITRMNSTFLVNRSERWSGLSPDAARRDVTLLRKALALGKAHLEARDGILIRTPPAAALIAVPMPASVEDWKSDHIIEAELRKGGRWPYHQEGARMAGYEGLVITMRECPESEALLKVGIHTVVNTLYHVIHGEGPHGLTLREAFDGGEVRDRREKYVGNDGEYIVATDRQANRLWKRSLLSYLEDCVTGASSKYFDRRAWLRDARQDGRGHALSSYDGQEHEVRAEDSTLFIYRVN